MTCKRKIHAHVCAQNSKLSFAQTFLDVITMMGKCWNMIGNDADHDDDADDGDDGYMYAYIY